MQTSPAGGATPFRRALKSGNTDGNGILCWRLHKFEIARANGFAPATRLSWAIPPEGVILHRRDIDYALSTHAAAATRGAPSA